jgi:ParB family transcriptional regulator, chromosome partitioning protein
VPPKPPSAKSPAKRLALGRGLDALLSKPGSAVAAVSHPSLGGGAIDLDVSKIDPSPHQPRLRMAHEAIEELARSIKESGVLQPIVVRHASRGRYELIAGERRFRAAKKAGLKRIPAVVRDVPDDRVLELALVENIQRENLSPVEEARAYKALSEKYGLTQEKIAERVGKERATVANAMRLLALSEKCLRMLEDGKISAGHAKVLLSLDDETLRERLASRVAADGLSVRAAEELAKAGVPLDPSFRRAKHGAKHVAAFKDPNVKKAEENLQRVLGTKVAISGKGKAGRIEIQYYSQEELHRLYDMLLLLGKK